MYITSQQGLSLGFTPALESSATENKARLGLPWAKNSFQWPFTTSH